MGSETQKQKYFYEYEIVCFQLRCDSEDSAMKIGMVRPIDEYDVCVPEELIIVDDILNFRPYQIKGKYIYKFRDIIEKSSIRNRLWYTLCEELSIASEVIGGLRKQGYLSEVAVFSKTEQPCKRITRDRTHDDENLRLFGYIRLHHRYVLQSTPQLINFKTIEEFRKNECVLYILNGVVFIGYLQQSHSNNVWVIDAVIKLQRIVPKVSIMKLENFLHLQQTIRGGIVMYSNQVPWFVCYFEAQPKNHRGKIIFKSDHCSLSSADSIRQTHEHATNCLESDVNQTSVVQSPSFDENKIIDNTQITSETGKMQCFDENRITDNTQITSETGKMQCFHENRIIDNMQITSETGKMQSSCTLDPCCNKSQGNKIDLNRQSDNTDYSALTDDAATAADSQDKKSKDRPVGGTTTADVLEQSNIVADKSSEVESLVVSDAMITMCPICKKTQPREWNVALCVYNHIGERFLNACPYCGRSFTSMGELREHHLKFHFKKSAEKLSVTMSMKCKICTFTVAGESDMRSHIRDMHKKFYYPCRKRCSDHTYCLKTYTNRISLDEHTIWEHEKSKKKRVTKEKRNKWFECPYCVGVLLPRPNSLSKHLRKLHSETFIHTCVFCARSFQNTRRLDGHQSYRGVEKVPTCPEYATMLRDGPLEYIQTLKDKASIFKELAASNEYDNAYLKQLLDTALKAKEFKPFKTLYESHVSILLHDVEVDSRCKSRIRSAPEPIWTPGAKRRKRSKSAAKVSNRGYDDDSDNDGQSKLAKNKNKNNRLKRKTLKKFKTWAVVANSDDSDDIIDDYSETKASSLGACAVPKVTLRKRKLTKTKIENNPPKQSKSAQ